MLKLCLFIAFLALACAAPSPSTRLRIGDDIVVVSVDKATANTWQCTACGILYDVVMLAEDIASGPLTTALEGACAATGPAAPVCMALVPLVVGAAETYGHKLKHDQLCVQLIHAC